MKPAWLARLHAAAFTAPPPWTADAFASLLINPDVFLLTRQYGFIIGRLVLDEAEVLTLAVDPTARRLGIGRDLLGEFMTLARIRGSATAFLEVAADNHAAIALYHAEGFVESGRRRGYYRQSDGQRADALAMTCQL